MGSSDGHVSIIICIGSNEPDATIRVRRAIDLLGTTFDIAGTSDPYPTVPAPPAPADGAPYANAVVRCRTSLLPDEITARLQQYEKTLGRCPEHKSEGRVVIDLDLVVYGDVVCRKSEFQSDYFQQGYMQLSEKSHR